LFKTGEKYEFHMMEGDSEVTFWGVIETYDPPLVKIADSEPITIQLVGSDDNEPVELTSIGPRPGKIINTHSSAFISAQIVADDR
jgi:hypothetical protein